VTRKVSEGWFKGVEIGDLVSIMNYRPLDFKREFGVPQVETPSLEKWGVRSISPDTRNLTPGPRASRHGLSR